MIKLISIILSSRQREDALCNGALSDWFPSCLLKTLPALSFSFFSHSLVFILFSSNISFLSLWIWIEGSLEE